MVATTVPAGLVGGLVATVAMTVLALATGDDAPPPTARLWSKYLGGDPAQRRLEGTLLHLVYGAASGALFVPALGALGVAAGSSAAGLLWGVVYGLVLFAVGAGFWLVLVLGFSPDRGTAMGFLAGHLVYGAVLGAWVGAGVLADLGAA